MKRYFFLCGCLAGLLVLSACSDEVMETGGTSGNTSPSGQGNSGEIVITLPTQIPAYGQTRAEGSDGLNTPGTCTVTNCVVLVFSAETQNGNYTCEQKISLEFGESQEQVFICPTLASGEKVSAGYYTRWVARGSFVPEAEKYYRLYAYAYNSEPNYFSKDLTNEITDGESRYLQNVDDSKNASELVTFTLPEHQATGDQPVEIFGGFLGAYKGGNWGDVTEEGTMAGEEVYNSTVNGMKFTEEEIKEIHFGGDLKRQTGRLDVTLTNIPDNVASLSMLMGSYRTTVPVGMEIITKNGLIYYHNPCPVINNEEVANGKVTASDGEGRSVTLTADMLRTEDSYVFIKAYSADSAEIDTYTVRCKNKEVELGPDAIVETIVSDGKVTVPANFWLQLKGDYEQLQKGNMSFDVSWGEDYNSGVTMGK